MVQGIKKETFVACLRGDHSKGLQAASQEWIVGDEDTYSKYPHLAIQGFTLLITKYADYEVWWRRGRVELPVQKQVARIYYKLSRLFNLA